jgi:glycosyltransferase involved in cell wall biosynthesis
LKKASNQPRNGSKTNWSKIHEKMESVSIVSPARNEEENIREFVEKSHGVLKKVKVGFEIVVVNDASTDSTGDILEKLKLQYKNLRVIHNRKVKGLTGSINVGFENAKNPIIMFLPSDLESNPVEDIPMLLNTFKEGYDIVVGWRYNKKDNLVKRMLTFMFNGLVSFLFKTRVHDLGWVKCFKKDVLNNIEPLRSDWHRFFIMLAVSEGYRVKEVKTRYYSRKKGSSKFGRFGLTRIPGAFFDLIVIKFFTVFSKRPMQIFGLIGLLFILVGVIVGTYILYLHLFVQLIRDRLPLILLTSLFLTMGILLFCIGIIAEYLVSIREQLRKKF